MDNLIDSTYFVRDRNLPEQLLADIDDQIEKHQKDVLKMLVGYDEYKLLEATDELIVGGEYDFGGFTVEYEGVKDMIAYYVYYQIIKESFQNVEGAGVAIAMLENATKVSPTEKLVSSWNKFVDYYIEAQRYLLQHTSDFPKLLLTSVDRINRFGI